MAAAGYPAVVDRDGVSPELRNDIEELSRRRAGLAAGWATVEAQNRRRRRHYGLVGTASAVGLLVAVTAAEFVPVFLSERGVLAQGTLNWLVPVGVLGTMAVVGGLYTWWYVASAEGAGPAPVDLPAHRSPGRAHRAHPARHGGARAIRGPAVQR